MSARTTALSALIACRRQNGWSDGVLKSYIERDRLDRRDAALASRLCYGVLQNRMLLDHYLSACLNHGMAKLQPVVADILRLGAYQILFLDRVPNAAAVDEAVQQGKKYANRQAAGLINAVLRALTRKAESIPMPASLALRYSHSEELVSLLADSIGSEELEALLTCNNEAPEATLQTNLLRVSQEEAALALEAEGVKVSRHPLQTDCFTIAGAGSPERLKAFCGGLVYVQDPAAKLTVDAADPKPGQRVLDCCGAPGGKSIAAAIAMRDSGEIHCCDLHEGKLRLVRESADRLGIHIIQTFARDARNTPEALDGQFDLVICDAPCSGLGVIRKKPDIRYKDLKETEKLPALQRAILDRVSRCVRPGGILLYSTCTILKRENEQVVQAFLKDHPEFSSEDFSLCGGVRSESGMLTLLPHRHHTDGFFIAKMRRRA